MVTEERPTHNSTFGIGGVSCSADSLVVKPGQNANTQNIITKPTPTLTKH